MLLLLAVGAIARVLLVLAGGRFFISDEGRYLHGMRLYFHALRGEGELAAMALQHADNLGFIFVSAFTTALQHGMSAFGPDAKWSGDFVSLQQNAVLGASVLSLAPVITVWIVYHLARRLGFDDREAFCAALVLSLSNTAFYFSRHLFPYEASIALMFGACLVAAGSGGGMRSAAAGTMAGMAFHVYNAYWYLLPLVVVVRLFSMGRTRQGFVNALVAVAGATLAVALPYLIGRWYYGPAFLQSTVMYGRSVVQGLYREGWSLPWEYLWHSEGYFGLLAVGLSAAFWLRLRFRQADATPARVRFLVACILGIWAVWIMVSTGAQLFVLNARTIKPVVPLLCLLSGWGLASWSRVNLRAGWIAGSLLVVLGGMNLLPHYWRVFPRDFEAVAIGQVGLPKRTATVTGSFFAAKPASATATDYALVNVQYLYPVRSPAALPEGQTTLSAAHPLEYLPYQYDGFTPRQRAILRSTDIRMRLVRLSAPRSVPDFPPPDFQSVNEDWPDGFDSEAEHAKRAKP